MVFFEDDLVEWVAATGDGHEAGLDSAADQTRFHELAEITRGVHVLDNVRVGDRGFVFGELLGREVAFGQRLE